MKKVKLSEIPVIQFPDSANYIDLTLKVKASGQDAIVFISGREHIPFNGDDKIVIVWDTPHEKFGKSCMTKYFDMPEPGELHWGHDGGIITLAK